MPPRATRNRPSRHAAANIGLRGYRPDRTFRPVDVAGRRVWAVKETHDNTLSIIEAIFYFFATRTRACMHVSVYPKPASCQQSSLEE